MSFFTNRSSHLIHWNNARNWALANSIVFLSISTLSWIAELDNISLLLTALAIYFIGGLLCFIRFLLVGNPLNPIAWYQLGSSIFFGGGVMIGAINANPMLYSTSEQIIDDLRVVNLLNSSSVFIVLLIAILSYDASQRKLRTSSHIGDTLSRIFSKLYQTLFYSVSVYIAIKIYTFPVIENLTFRSIVGYLAYLEPAFCLTFAYLLPQLNRMQKILGYIAFAIIAILGLLSFSKQATMLPILILCIGYWLRKSNLKSIVLGATFLVVMYALVQPANTIARNIELQTSDTPTLFYRIKTLNNAAEEFFLGNALQHEDSSKDSSAAVSALMRVSTFEVQGFLISEFNNNREGNSLDNFWIALIPRLIWPDKPNITRHGNDLDGLFWGRTGDSSALAPTYNGEAYWNYGPKGVLIISVILGLQLAWFAHHAHLARIGKDPAYYFICVPAILVALYVETWITASYVGGFITLFLIYQVFRFLLPKK